MEFFYVQCSGVFSKPSLFDVKKSLLLNIGQTKRRLVSTSSARSQFKLDGKRRKLDPNRPAPHTLRNRCNILFTQNLSFKQYLKENSDLPGDSTNCNGCCSPGASNPHIQILLMKFVISQKITIFHRSGHQQDDRLFWKKRRIKMKLRTLFLPPVEVVIVKKDLRYSYRTNVE